MASGSSPAARQALLLEISRGILEEDRDETALAQFVYARISKLIDADMCFNYAVDQTSCMLRLVAGFGIPPALLGGAQTLRLGQASRGVAGAARAPLAADATRMMADDHRAFVRAMGGKAYACHALPGKDGSLLGTLSFASTRRDHFSQDEISFLQAACDFVALAWQRQRAEAIMRENERRYYALFEAAPFAVIVIDPATHAILDVNDYACADYGYEREEFLRLKISDIDVLGDSEVMRRRGRSSTVRPGTQEFEAKHRRKSGEIRDVLVRVHGVQLGGRDVSYGAHIDITERKAAEGRQILLARELDHRSRNILSVVQAALRLTPRDDPEAYVRAIEGRLGALARAHSMLAEARWERVELRGLLAGELAPFISAQRVELNGPAVSLAPTATQPLAMAMHELATNAVKHGALSVPKGRISINWQLAGAERDKLRLRWTETNGPVITGPPTRRGFGSRVIAATVQTQLGGTVHFDRPATGLVCSIEVPLAPSDPLVSIESR